MQGGTSVKDAVSGVNEKVIFIPVCLEEMVKSPSEYPRPSR
jgi:hypothetical protein